MRTPNLTLVEWLVAISIVAIVGLILWQIALGRAYPAGWQCQSVFTGSNGYDYICVPGGR